MVIAKTMNIYNFTNISFFVFAINCFFLHFAYHERSHACVIPKLLRAIDNFITSDKSNTRLHGMFSSSLT